MLFVFAYVDLFSLYRRDVRADRGRRDQRVHHQPVVSPVDDRLCRHSQSDGAERSRFGSAPQPGDPPIGRCMLGRSRAYPRRVASTRIETRAPVVGRSEIEIAASPEAVCDVLTPSSVGRPGTPM